MKLRVCPDCKAIHDTTARGARAGRCPDCSRTRDRQRPTPVERGYDADHRAQRRAWQARLDADEPITCWRCGDLVGAEPWDLGHDDQDRTVTRGPEHRGRCNRSAAGKSAHATGRHTPEGYG